MTVLQEQFLLSNGMPMPKVGFGTWQITDAQQAYDATTSALTNGDLKQLSVEPSG